jgi:hypothetical protein
VDFEKFQKRAKNELKTSLKRASSVVRCATLEARFKLV